MYYFIYDGIDSRDMGIRVKKADTLSSPQRSVESIEIIGRGVHYFDNGNYENRIISLECQIIASKDQMPKKASDILAWLQTNVGFKDLIWSEDPDYIYQAIFVNNISIARSIMQVGEFQIVFECKPFKELKNGDQTISITQTTIIRNPTPHNSNPYMKIYGTGDVTISINNQSIVIKDIDEYIEIDSDIMDCYKDTNSCNNKLYSVFPYLESGSNAISWVGNVTKVEIKPRWRSL